MGNNQSDRLEKDGNAEAALSVEAAEGQVEVSATNSSSSALPEIVGGNGGIAAASDVRMLCRAVTKGWLTEPSKLNEAKAALLRVVDDPRSRPGVVAIAAKAIADIEQNTVTTLLRLAEADDKAGRLDEGKATENIAGITMVIREADSDDG